MILECFSETEGKLRVVACDENGRLLIGGAAIDIGSLHQTLAYDGNGRLSTITVTQGADSYRQTLTYDGAGKLTGVSAWVKL